MTTVAQLVEQTRQRLAPGQRPVLNKLNGALTSGSTSATLTYDIQGVGPNTRVSIGLEDLHVWDATQATKIASPLQRGMYGSTAMSHADGSLVVVNGEFSTWEIVRAFNEVLAALPGEGVFNFLTVSLTSNAAKVGYNLTSVGNLLGVQQVRYSAVGSQSKYVTINRRNWDVDQALPTGDFAAGEALFIYEPIDPGRTLQVLYKAPFTALDTLTDADLDDVVETQIVGSGEPPPSSIGTLLSVGAALRLTQGRPVERSSSASQGQTRRPEEVSTSDTRLAASPLELEWQRALHRARREQKTRHTA